MKAFKSIIWITVLIGSMATGYAQSGKRAMTVDDLVNWERITQKKISDDGKWIAVRQSPWQGDPTVIVYESSGNKLKEIPLGNKVDFSPSSEFVIISLTSPKAVTDSLKLKKTKKDDMPMDRLLLLSVKGNEEIIDSVRSYKIAGNADWIAYQRGNKKDSTLYVRSLDGETTREFPHITEFGFPEEGNSLYYLSQPENKDATSGLYTYSIDNNESRLILEGQGLYKQITPDKKGNNLAFLYCEEKDSTSYAYSVYLTEKNNPARKIAGKENKELPEGWIISPEGKISFSENAGQIYLGIAPLPKEKDSTVLAENRPNVQVWTWNEGTQYTVQDKNLKNDLKKSYTAVLHPGKNKLVPLATVNIPQIITTPEKEASVVLGVSNKPYEVSSMWRGRGQVDVYTINIETGEKELIKEGVFARPQISPEGKYAFWYSAADSSWYTYNIATRKEFRLTTPQTFIAWNEDNDVPDYPSAYGTAGWTKNDEYLLVYDRYDIWQFDPEAKKPPVNLTVNGRQKGIRYFWESLEKDEINIDTKKQFLLSGVDEKTKNKGYYSARFNAPNQPRELIEGPYVFRAPVKAKNADRIIYTCESYTQFPDIYASDLSFKNPVQITNNHKQQEPFIWGTAELVKWVSFDGKPLQGVVYKPADFDPNKQYPLIVNFYERNSDNLHAYKMPEPHRSTIDYRLYNSNGYIIFNPDAVYDDGYPGESCYNCVMPGIAMLMGEGFINEKAIGAQGHSWGGYQVAYLATRTRLFAAIESGAPVVNMLSAYGGIRWETGLNRSFQYEHGQSRIGGNIWETPLRYIENSPLFTMDKVQTPILIMHNDADGHVPWYQGIEYFVALRRLQKPAWLLNYTGEPHWPLKMPNQVDFQIRMFQFFEHYLNNKPMPKWMSEGVPAVDRDFESGY